MQCGGVNIRGCVSRCSSWRNGWLSWKWSARSWPSSSRLTSSAAASSSPSTTRSSLTRAPNSIRCLPAIHVQHSSCAPLNVCRCPLPGIPHIFHHGRSPDWNADMQCTCMLYVSQKITHIVGMIKPLSEAFIIGEHSPLTAILRDQPAHSLHRPTTVLNLPRASLPCLSRWRSSARMRVSAQARCTKTWRRRGRSSSASTRRRKPCRCSQSPLLNENCVQSEPCFSAPISE